jgi:hypothetical protein
LTEFKSLVKIEDRRLLVKALHNYRVAKDIEPKLIEKGINLYYLDWKEKANKFEIWWYRNYTPKELASHHLRMFTPWYKLFSEDWFTSFEYEVLEDMAWDASRESAIVVKNILETGATEIYVDVRVMRFINKWKNFKCYI